ncbi:LacI family DNA-binding transcriptional regulator [uncultured Massilia sp.]|uniref:LacI family DNA-binding transcriptional regulator n=1 Tax=uncultured Massilia sp. TaxID=169973 RepID=UPI0025F5792A|nr:LacI family DNA-binding transcriptional regulator [uncultured Massilia sp.]
MKNTAPTLHDVAAAARVSTATVSKFINGVQRFSPAVEAAIAAAIASLGYRSNQLARSMVTGRTATVGIALPDPADPHVAPVLKGAARVAAEQGFAVLLVDTGAAQGPCTPQDLGTRVDGVLVAASARDEDRGWTTGFGKPLVHAGDAGGDDHAGACMLARHLLMLGHRRFAWLGCPAAAGNARRLADVRDCLAAAGLAPDVVDADAPTLAEGTRLCAGIVLGERRPDALLCCDDLLALGFMKEASRLGLAIPRELSVAGFGNLACGDVATPGLTTVDPHGERVGAGAMRLLLARVRGEAPPRPDGMAPQLVLRASTAARQP